MASGDHLSGGRFEFGIGAGWNREEMRNHGTDPRQRMQLLAERVEAMKAIWTQHEASYKGMFVLLPCDPAVLERLAAADDAAAGAPVLRAGAGRAAGQHRGQTRRSQSSQTTTTTTGTRCGGCGRR